MSHNMPLPKIVACGVDAASTMKSVIMESGVQGQYLLVEFSQWLDF
jgi:hypothetical protein